MARAKRLVLIAACLLRLARVGAHISSERRTAGGHRGEHEARLAVSIAEHCSVRLVASRHSCVGPGLDAAAIAADLFDHSRHRRQGADAGRREIVDGFVYSIRQR